VSDPITVAVLGPLEVCRAGTAITLSRARHRALVSLLAIRSPRALPADQIVDELWSGDPPASGNATLQAYVSLVRKAIGPGVLVSRDGGYALDIEPGAIDARRFAAGVADGLAATAAGDHDVAATALRGSLAIWRGPAFAEFAEQPWASVEVAGLNELRVEAIEACIDAELALGRHHGLVAELEHLVVEHPFREALWGQLMLALYRCGRQAEALGAYSRLRIHLGEELGIEPTPTLARLEEAIILQKPELDWSEPLATSSLTDRADSTPAAPLHPPLALPGTPAGPGLPQRPALLRPRLLAQLAGRFDHRVVLLTAGGGFGKTTLLGQALRANLVDLRGVDAWVPCRPADTAPSQLGRAILRALGATSQPGDDPAALVGAICQEIWLRAPQPITVILDDAHVLLADGQPTAGFDFVASVLDNIPTNGHLVLASRVALPLPLARLRAHGEVLDIDENDLRFDEGELDALAELRDVDSTSLSSYGGWPALTDLAASAGHPVVQDFLWEEVLAARPDGHRDALARAAAIRSAGPLDADLARAVGIDIPLPTLLADLPLTRQLADGRYELHALWSEQADLALALGEEVRHTVLLAAADQCERRGQLDSAFRVRAQAGDLTGLTALVASVCFANHPPLPADVLAGWVDLLPDELRDTAEGRLLLGLVQRSRSEFAEAVTTMQLAAAQFGARGEIEPEAITLRHVGLVAFWTRDVPLGAVVHQRMIELLEAGSVEAGIAIPVGRAMTIMALTGDWQAAIDELADLDGLDLGGDWASVVAWARSFCLVPLDRTDEALETIERVLPFANAVFWPELEGVRLNCLWARGEVDAVVAGADALVAAAQRAGVEIHALAHLALASSTNAWLGDVDAARRHLETLRTIYEAEPADALRRLAFDMGCAAVAIAEGDDERAIALARASYEDTWKHGTENPGNRGGTIAYVAVPDWRERLATETTESWVIRRRLCDPLIAWREEGRLDAAATLEWPDADQVRAQLPLPWGIELACLSAAAGNPGGHALIERLGEQALPWLDRLCALAAATDGDADTTRPATGGAAPSADDVARVATAARDLVDVAMVSSPIRIAVLSTPVVVAFADGTRSEVIGAPAAELRDFAVALAGPDLGDAIDLPPSVSTIVRAGARRAEPVRQLDLQIDLWEFDQLLDEADEAEHRGLPRLALTAYDHALALVMPAIEQRLFDATPDDRATDGQTEPAVPIAAGGTVAGAAWQEAWLRTRRLAARSAVRAGELELATGDTKAATTRADDALAADTAFEPAHRLRISARLAEGDRSGAAQAVDACLAALQGADRRPDAATDALCRLVERQVAAR
jgi:LuxR family maltose regulon positive regulatory protein